MTTRRKVAEREKRREDKGTFMCTDALNKGWRWDGKLRGEVVSGGGVGKGGRGRSWKWIFRMEIKSQP